MTFMSSTTVRNLSLVHLFIGVSMLVLAILDVTEVKWWTSKVAFGVWTGGLVFLAGASGLVSSRLNSSAWSTMFLVLCGLSSLTSLVLVVAYSLALEEVSRDWRFNSYELKSTPSTGVVSSQPRTKVAITSAMLVLGVAGFLMSLWSFGSYCVSYCLSPKCQHILTELSPSKRPTHEVLYLPQETNIQAQANQPVTRKEAKQKSVMNVDSGYPDAQDQSPRRMTKNGSLGPSSPVSKPNQSPARSYAKEALYRTPATSQGLPRGKAYDHPKKYPSHGAHQGKNYSHDNTGEKTYI